MAIGLRGLTLEQFLALPEEKPALEYDSGEVTQKMSPLGPHGTTQFEIAVLVDRACRPRELARAFTETRTTYAGKSFVPDVVVYRWDRVPSDEHGDIPLYFTTPPDIAIEIASPGQGVQNLLDRCRWYVDNGVQVSLMIQPRHRAVWEIRPGSEAVRFGADDRLDLTDVVDGLTIDLAQLFRALRSRFD